MRGRRHGSPSPLRIVGLTPAHAGKTRRAPTCFLPMTAHPRACGEDLLGKHLPGDFEGSPPRMRGRRVPPEHGQEHWGLTPAHAGKTLACSLTPCCRRARPRACGEDLGQHSHNLQFFGSPPRMRGRRGADREARHPKGLTPAHAGKTAPGRSTGPAHRAHPRACGEDRWANTRNRREYGSPPRMRGRPMRTVHCPAPWWLTPAHAGKTIFCRTSTSRSGAHPRACGEDRGVAGC